MSKKALLSLVLIGVLALGLGIGSYAWFTSSATSTENTFTAGTLKLASEGEGSIDIILRNDGFVEPSDVLTGDDSTEFATITIENDGNLNMATFGRFTLEGVETEEQIEFARDIKITDYYVEFYDAEESLRTDRYDNFIEDGVPTNNQFALNIYDWVNGNGPLDCPGTPWDIEALRPGEKFVITFRLVYDELATVQGQSVELGYKVLGTQVKLGALQALQANNDDLAGVVMSNHIQYFENQVQ